MKSQLQVHRNVKWFIHTTAIFGIVFSLSGCGDDDADTVDNPTSKCVDDHMKLKDSYKDTEVCYGPASVESCKRRCCVEKDETSCGAKNRAGQLNCESDKVFDVLKDGAKAGDTASEQTTNCCSERQKCKNNLACPAGWKAKPDAKGELACWGSKCNVEERSDVKQCCDVETTKCMYFDATEQKICNSGREMDERKLDVEFKSDSKDQDCCKPLPQCSSINCDAAGGWETDANKAKTYCDGDGCKPEECCTKKTGTCRAIKVDCASTEWKDDAKGGIEAGTTTEAQKKNCCTKKATCAEFKAA